MQSGTHRAAAWRSCSAASVSRPCSSTCKPSQGRSYACSQAYSPPEDVCVREFAWAVGGSRAGVLQRRTSATSHDGVAAEVGQMPPNLWRLAAHPCRGPLTPPEVCTYQSTHVGVQEMPAWEHVAWAGWSRRCSQAMPALPNHHAHTLAPHRAARHSHAPAQPAEHTESLSSLGVCVLCRGGAVPCRLCRLAGRLQPPLPRQLAVGQ